MKNKLAGELTETKDELINTIALFDNGSVNIIPFEGSWTGGKVAEHILLSASGVLKALNGPTKHTDRDPEEKVKILADTFLNFNIKMTSPDFILPTDGQKDKNTLSRSLEKVFDEMATTAETKDLTATCTSFEMPVLGELTRTEFICFTIYHTKRHIHQLKNIVNHLNN